MSRLSRPASPTSWGGNVSSPSDPGPDPGRRGRLTPAVSPDEPMAGSDDAGVGQDVNPARVSEPEGEGKMLETAIENVEKNRRHADGSANADDAEVVTAVCDTGDTMSAEASTQNQELKQKRKGMLPRELRIKIYEDVLVLRKQGLSYGQIIEEIKRRYNVTISKSTLSGWKNRKHSPYNGIRIPTLKFLKPSEDLAYLIGVEVGDGYVYKRSKLPPRYDEFVVGLMVKDKDFSEFFARTIEKVLKRKPPKPRLSKDGRWVVEVQSRTLYDLLQKPLNVGRIRPYVEHCERCIAAFLRGFFDSEGTIRENGEIGVANTDYKLLEYVIYLLKKIGIETTSEKPILRRLAGTLLRDPDTGKIYKRRKDCYYVQVSMKSNLTFYEKVGFTIERKRKRLEDYLKRRGLLPNDSLMT
ncbi:MAG: LAGLIDADG family homing endonuclease [Nitrososphaerota archaeon]